MFFAVQSCSFASCVRIVFVFVLFFSICCFDTGRRLGVQHGWSWSRENQGLKSARLGTSSKVIFQTETQLTLISCKALHSCDVWTVTSIKQKFPGSCCRPWKEHVYDFSVLKLNDSQCRQCSEVPCLWDLRMAQIPEQPELERPRTTPASTRDGSQSLNTRGFKSMKTAGTVKFQSTSGSGPLGATRKKSGFPSMGVPQHGGGFIQNRWFIRENPSYKWII